MTIKIDWASAFPLKEQVAGLTWRCHVVLSRLGMTARTIIDSALSPDRGQPDQCLPPVIRTLVARVNAATQVNCIRDGRQIGGVMCLRNGENAA